MTNASTSHGEASHIFSLFVAKAIRAPLWLLLSAVLARFLEPSGLGVWSMILAVSALMNQVLLHWTQAITQRFGRRELLDTHTLMTTYSARIPFLMIGWLIAFLLLIYQPFSWLTRFYGLHSEDIVTLFAVLSSLWFMAEAQSLQQVFAKFQRVAWLPISADVLLLISIILCLATGFYVGGVLANKVMAIALFLMLFWGGVLLWELRTAKAPLKKLSFNDYKQRFLFASPLILGFVVGYLSEWCDYFLIRYYYSEHEVGLFHSAYQYMLLLVGLPTAIVTVMLPRLSLELDNDNERNEKLLYKTIPILSFFWLFASFFMMVVIPPIFNILLGDKFVLSRGVLIVLLSVVPSAIVIHLYGMLCFLQGRLFFSTVIVYSIKIIINIVLSFWLLPLYGILGSAISILISYFLLQWLFVFDQYKLLKSKSITPLLMLFFVQFYSLLMVFISEWYQRIALSVFFAAIAFIYVRNLSLITKQDVLLMPLHNYPKLQSALLYLFVSRGQQTL